jgi:prepilin-type N-terminal cleavage/methylation domain-containing protein
MFPVKREDAFTLLEVIIAVAILSIALVLVLQVLATARARVLRSERKWARAHLLQQGAEYFLLAGPDAMVPQEFLPEGFSARCELVAATEPLPEHARDADNGWVPVIFRVSILDRSGKQISSCEIEKTVPAEDLR